MSFLSSYESSSYILNTCPLSSMQSTNILSVACFLFSSLQAVLLRRTSVPHWLEAALSSLLLGLSTGSSNVADCCIKANEESDCVNKTKATVFHNLTFKVM